MFREDESVGVCILEEWGGRRGGGGGRGTGVNGDGELECNLCRLDAKLSPCCYLNSNERLAL